MKRKNTIYFLLSLKRIRKRQKALNREQLTGTMTRQSPNGLLEKNKFEKQYLKSHLVEIQD